MQNEPTEKEKRERMIDLAISGLITAAEAVVEDAANNGQPSLASLLYLSHKVVTARIVMGSPIPTTAITWHFPDGSKRRMNNAKLS